MEGSQPETNEQLFLLARAEALQIIRDHVEDWETVFNSVLAYEMQGALALVGITCEPYADLIEELDVEALLCKMGEFANNPGAVDAFAEQIPEEELERLARFLRFFYHMARPQKK